MKKYFLLILCTFIFVSCGTVLPPYYSLDSWARTREDRTRGTLRLLGVSVDKAGGAHSVEREAVILAPLCFWEHGYRVAAEGEPADYAVQISLREREYPSGWKTLKSLSAEIVFWPNDTASGMPLAAGRVMVSGDISLSSSSVHMHLLSLVSGKGIAALNKYSRAKKKLDRITAPDTEGVLR